MPYKVSFYETPEPVIAEAQTFLLSKPVHHNLVLTLLNDRKAHPQPGRYWVVSDGEEAVAVALQSPLQFVANITPAEPEIVAALVENMALMGPILPGINGEASTAASFAGLWTERLKSGATPVQGQRIYEAPEVTAQNAPGVFRKATAEDRDMLVEWMRGFYGDIGEQGSDPGKVVDQRLPEGQFWIWDDNGAVSMAAHSKPIEGVVRIQIVYTPRGKRDYGYAGACVAALAGQILREGYRCILYTDLANPVSNAVFRRIGFRSISEGLKYKFMYAERS